MKKERKTLLTLLLFFGALSLIGCGKQQDEESVGNFSVKECAIVYDDSDYMSKRYAYRLYEELDELVDEKLELVSSEDVSDDMKRIIISETEGLDGEPVMGNGKISVNDSVVNFEVDSYYGFEIILDYFRVMCEETEDYIFEQGFVWKGNHTQALDDEEKTSAYAYERGGDYRVMFYNVLWISPGYIPNDKPGERNVLQAEMLAQYLPDVIGLQECNQSKRDMAKEQNIVTLFGELGYAEVQVTVENSLGANCTPIFYNTKAVNPITGGYLNYQNQYYDGVDESKGLTWCLFETLQEEQFIVVSTHMETHKAGVRVCQAKEATRLISDLIEEYQVPVILGGDFNTKMGSATYEYYTETAGYQDVLEIATEFSSIIRPNHSYPRYLLQKKMMQFNGMYSRSGDVIANDFGTGVDHILLANYDNIETNIYGVVVDDCTKSASDHFPIFVDFSITD